MAGIYDRRMFRMQAGGMMPPMQEAPIDQMSFVSPEQEAQIYQEAQNLPPEVLQAADRDLASTVQDMTADEVNAAVGDEVARSVGNLEAAGDYRDVMNAVWEDDADIEAYRNKLAEVVGWEDADRTPDSVLALVQPTLQLAQIDQGIGALMQEELAEVGAVGGGITDLGPEGAVAEGMSAETNALVNAVGNMAQGPSGMMAPGEGPTGMDPRMLQAMMQGAGPMGQGMV
jgi:hypothetical protein